ncbi:MAG: cupin domain-containing protein [Persicimonas sp.]
MSTDQNRQERLRPHPALRFAEPERKLDLADCFEDLLDEPHDATEGHRQITIARHGSQTLTLFHFTEGSRLPEHKVDGAVTIHVLDGELEVETDEEVHRLGEGQLLMLAPGIEHDVRAQEESRMLLTVHLMRQEERSSVSKPD